MEINPLVEGYHEDVTENIEQHVSWKNPDLKRIIRLRLLTDRDFPFYDVSIINVVRDCFVRLPI